MNLGTLSKKLGLLAIATTLSGTSLLMSAPAQAQRSTQAPQVLLEEQGTLEPVQDEYTFSGKKGQAVTIAMTSDIVDSYLVLMAPNGEEIATNDDFARSLNAAIVMTLPNDGTYKVQARSISGEGGDYSITVKPATAYEQAYARGITLFLQDKLSEAITAYSEAIQLEPDQPIAYLDRGDVYYAQDNLQGLIADYQKAAELYDKLGDRDNAQMVRDQIQYLEEADRQSSLFSYPESSSFLMP
jgi:tetratricopeptide (TPR) repeat protein